MDQKTKDQLNYALEFLSIKVLSAGSSIWEVGDVPYPSRVSFNGTIWRGEELAEHCVNAKRSGNYPIAIGGCTNLLKSALNETGKIPLFIVIAFFKILVSANAFYTAWGLVTTIYADLQGNKSNGAQAGLFYFQKYFKELASIAIDVVDNRDYSSVEAFSANYSGNPYYTLPNSKKEIYEDMVRIRNDLRRVYKF